MPKGSKQATLRTFSVGDKVKYKTHVTAYEITRISPDGRKADICIPRTNFEIFRVSTADLTFV
jgi:hypothetical protein